MGQVALCSALRCYEDGRRWTTWAGCGPSSQVGRAQHGWLHLSIALSNLRYIRKVIQPPDHGARGRSGRDGGGVGGRGGHVVQTRNSAFRKAHSGATRIPVQRAPAPTRSDPRQALRRRVEAALRRGPRETAALYASLVATDVVCDVFLRRPGRARVSTPTFPPTLPHTRLSTQPPPPHPLAFPRQPADRQKSAGELAETGAGPWPEGHVTLQGPWPDLLPPLSPLLHLSLAAASFGHALSDRGCGRAP